LQRSFMVGDKIDDLLLARKAKLAFGILVRTGNGRQSEKKLRKVKLGRSAVVSNILSAAKWIAKKQKG
jgi:histidinol phosphatase-like enzyme